MDKLLSEGEGLVPVCRVEGPDREVGLITECSVEGPGREEDLVTVS